MSGGFIDRRLENQWDRQLEEGLPDSRLRNREKNRIYRGGMWWETVYCASCGKPGGLVTADWSPHTFFVCDPCVAKNGSPPGVAQLAEVDEAAARGISQK